MPWATRCNDTCLIHSVPCFVFTKCSKRDKQGILWEHKPSKYVQIFWVPTSLNFEIEYYRARIFIFILVKENMGAVCSDLIFPQFVFMLWAVAKRNFRLCTSVSKCFVLPVTQSLPVASHKSVTHGRCYPIPVLVYSVSCYLRGISGLVHLWEIFRIAAAFTNRCHFWLAFFSLQWYWCMHFAPVVVDFLISCQARKTMRAI